MGHKRFTYHVRKRHQMKCFLHLQHAITWLAIGGICLPIPAAFGQHSASVAASSTAAADSRILIRDAVLKPGGLLSGQLIDGNLRPVIGADVTIQFADNVVATTRTDANGVFAVTGLRGGTHQIVTPHGSSVCRFWATGTAPPRTTDQLVIIDDSGTVRGQAGPRFREEFFPHAKAIATHPLVVGGLIAAAIAIPASLRNSDRPPGS
jgi:hypothetical protein